MVLAILRAAETDPQYPCSTPANALISIISNVCSVYLRVLVMGLAGYGLSHFKPGRIWSGPDPARPEMVLSISGQAGYGHVQIRPGRI